MPLIETAFPGAAGVALAMLVAATLASVRPVTAAPAKATPSASASTVRELDAVRLDCIAAARDAQQHEQAIASLEHTVDLLRRDAEGRQRGLDESRPEQARLLGTLAHLARDPPERPAFAPAATIERIRGEMLLQGTLPGLRAEARALAGEIERIAALREQIASKKAELTGVRQVRGADRTRLAELTARRLDVTRRLLQEDSGGAARIAKLGHEASDIVDLIKRADAAVEGRDKEVLARAALPKEKASALAAVAADPTRPPQLQAFDPPRTVLVMPVAGTIARRFGVADVPAGPTSSQGLRLAALPGAVAVAPFDGRVIYAGPFRNFGLVLIIRHAGLYYSLLAGLERIDMKVDQWVLTGEPVGAMPEASGAALYVELRRDDRPVDPQPWLALGAAGRNEPDGDQRVNE